MSKTWKDSILEPLEITSWKSPNIFLFYTLLCNSGYGGSGYEVDAQTAVLTTQFLLFIAGPGRHGTFFLLFVCPVNYFSYDRRFLLFLISSIL